MALKVQQRQFASILYDSLFGLVLFFSLESFLEITEFAHFLFYLFSTIVVIHWWLMFKAADDTFEKGVRDTALHIFVNVTYILMLQIMILHASEFAYQNAAAFLLAMVLLDASWAIMVLRLERWGTRSKKKIAVMKKELFLILRSNAVLVVGLGGLFILSPYVAPLLFVLSYVALYLLFMYLTFKYKIINIKLF